jgi:quercetin dioxygenase-like cupin family protein
MQISRTGTLPPEPVDHDHFLGETDRRSHGPTAIPNGEPGAALVVTFLDGARTRWHRHAGGQLLYVLDGSGFVTTRGGEPREIKPGDLVQVPSGEEHWHGAAPGGQLTHLAFSFGETTWGS